MERQQLLIGALALALLLALTVGLSQAQRPEGAGGAGTAVSGVIPFRLRNASSAKETPPEGSRALQPPPERTDVRLMSTPAVTYELLIIAPDDFAVVLEPLVDHKNATDMPAVMVTLEAIYRGFAGVDAPEQIKTAIQHYEQNHHVEYVMLVGDVNRFPVRWQAGQLVDAQTDYVYLPSDYYYADLYDGSGAFNDWDADGDRYYGEIYRNNLNPDGIDFEPDVKVGRVPAADVTQAETYVAKVIRYEHTAHGSDWFQRVLLIQDGFTGDIDAKENIAHDLSDFEPVRLYEHINAVDYSGPVSDSVSAATISAGFNEGVGFVTFTSHNTPQQWEDENRNPVYEIRNIRLDLHNAYTLPVIYSGGCQSTQFFYETVPYCRPADCPTWTYLGEDGSLHAGTSVGSVGTSFYARPAVTQTGNLMGIGEAFLVESENGGIAYFGCQETGQVGTHRVLDEAFFEAYSLGHHVLGDMWEYAVETFVSHYNVTTIAPDGSWPPTCKVHTPSRYILFGDPSLRVGGVAGLEDTVPPTTSDDADGDWLNERATVRLTAVDGGTPPSGVRSTLYAVDGGAEQQGTRFTVETPADHSNDGLHTFQYYSIDFLENAETSRTSEFRLDTVDPDTDVLFDGEPPAMVFCPPGGPCPEIACYTSPVNITLSATDDRSGVAYTWYRLDDWLNVYSEPFDAHAWDYLRWRTLEYWSEDNAGNAESPEEVDFCVSNWRAGMLRDEIRILAALEEIVAMRMRKDFASTLPPIRGVDFELRYPLQQEWGLIATDENGADGWGVTWKTSLVADGHHLVRMRAWGFPSPKGMGPQEDPLLYEEQVGVTVCNIPADDYQFGLYTLSDEFDRGEAIAYTLQFVNHLDEALKNLRMTCDLDAGFFEEFKVQDGGSLDQHGMPTWSLEKLDSGATWQTHFSGWTRADVVPGTVIAAQALLTADTVPLLLSDDPNTPGETDWTAVTIKLIDGAITGYVEDADLGTPMAASVTLEGPASQTVDTDAAGYYTAADLPPGTYTVSVVVEGYDYHNPTGPAGVTLDGTVETVQLDFLLRRADTRAPYSTLSPAVDEIVQGAASKIYGTAHDHAPGSGVASVALSIRCANDATYWDGAGWTADETWLLAAGTTAWTYDAGGIPWESGHAYTIKVRATDNAGNVEMPVTHSTTPAAPNLISPPDGTTTDDATPAFDWSDVPDARYMIELDNDSDFWSPEVHEIPLLSTSAYQPAASLPAGTYHWHVKAVDGAYVAGDWSEAWTVTITPAQRIYLPRILRGSQEVRTESPSPSQRPRQ